MKKFKTALRYWIALISLMGFLGGWVTLAHARKPIQNSSTTTNANVLAVPTLAPLQPMNLNGAGGTTNSNSNNNSIFNFQLSNSQPQPQSGFPVISTRGS